MGAVDLRFRKSVKIMPGLRVNLFKSGVSTSIGGRGATVNIGKRGLRSTLSVPGTGLSWSTMSGWVESRQSRPTEEIEQLRSAAMENIEAVSKKADEANAIGKRIDKAIGTLNGGRGLTHSKAQTFEKRCIAEEQNLADLEEDVHECVLFLYAIETRLRAMSFGLFASGNKRQRDNVAESVATCARNAKDIESQLTAAHDALSDKLSEVQGKLEISNSEG